MKTINTLAAIILFATIAPQSILAALIRNGSFEESVSVPTGLVTIKGSNKTDIAPWEVTGDSVDLIKGAWAASNGEKSLDLNGTGTGGIRQTFATDAGRAYRVTFDMAGNPGRQKIAVLEVAAAGQKQQVTFDVIGKTAQSMGWEQRAFVFTATQASTTIEFKSLVVGGGHELTDGPALDNVSATAIAESGSRVLSLSSSTDYIAVPDNDSLDFVSIFTLEAWINPSRIVNQEQAVISKPKSPTGTGVELRTFGRGASLGVNGDSGSNNGINLVFGGGTTLELNTWQHIAATYDGSLGNVYIDGLLVASNRFSLKLLNGSVPLTIGQKNPPGSPLVGSFLGQIDEVRVWNRALSQAEIQSSMSRRLTGHETGLVGYWDFDSGTATDKSDFGNHGTIVGQAKTVAGFMLLPTTTPPKLLSGGFSFLQGYRFTLDGEANASYVVETSTDLSQWTPLITVKTTTVPLVFTDPSATNFPSHRFYRARQVP